MRSQINMTWHNMSHHIYIYWIMESHITNLSWHAMTNLHAVKNLEKFKVFFFQFC
jgi:hypothetical protein